ncbi:MAG: hypothetical protein AAF675_04195 [Pseudomonadota bacterium]
MIGTAAHVIDEACHWILLPPGFTETMILDATLSQFLSIAAATVVGSLAITLGFGAVTSLGLAVERGETPDMMRALQHGLDRMFSLVAACLLASSLLLVSLFAFVLPAIWFLAYCAVLMPVVMEEGRGFGALRRSAALTKTMRWPIALLIVGPLIVLSLILIGIDEAVPALNNTIPGLGFGLHSIGYGVCALVMAQLAVALYVDLRALERSASEP